MASERGDGACRGSVVTERVGPSPAAVLRSGHGAAARTRPRARDCLHATANARPPAATARRFGPLPRPAASGRRLGWLQVLLVYGQHALAGVDDDPPDGVVSPHDGPREERSAREQALAAADHPAVGISSETEAPYGSTGNGFLCNPWHVQPFPCLARRHHDGLSSTKVIFDGRGPGRQGHSSRVSGPVAGAFSSRGRGATSPEARRRRAPARSDRPPRA